MKQNTDYKRFDKGNMFLRNQMHILKPYFSYQHLFHQSQITEQ